MQVIKVADSIGTILCHDITKITPREFKGPAFKKGHIITEQDIPELLKLGKEHIYVWELKSGFVHENDAGLQIAQAIKGMGLVLTEPYEGKVNLIAANAGICLIDEERLLRINRIEEIVVATRNNKRPVKKGDIIAGVRVVPLVIDKRKLSLAEAIGQENNIISVKAFQPLKVGIITTGGEVYYGRIKDEFGPVVKAKVEAFGCQTIAQIVVPDDAGLIAQAAATLIGQGAQLILTTGGMSVDPDDVTPSGIKKAGATIVSYGAPVLPGSMFMMAYLGYVPVLGLPGCVMYNKTTVFDLILPLVLAGQKINRSDIVKLGVGGLCLNCEVCRYPACSFGTGV
jgi:molybdenum cofactor synthesis domain-containing protein